ncbi:MAG: bifunctional hydroxymethylpyrimidine kinase/phosphomethylpyrimidine kinase [Pedobacter sp.]|nr:MAG: bifunctional hydroxymethylpyrimidine kinase/phosphomethylpyrimidine kinase [Pedobacter sp.]
MKSYTYPSVLTIAGFDGSGGAGIQADIKTMSALGCYATSVLTALPIQNTVGVKSIYPIPNDVVAAQMEAVMDDIFPSAIKIGMVHTGTLITTIINILQKYPAIPVVFDPVMVSSSGRPLIEADTIKVMVDKLFPIVTLVTPNLDEASVLADMPIETVDDMYAAGAKIKRSCKTLLIKGGHLKDEQLTSLYFDEAGDVYPFRFQKHETNNTHGTGCTLSSAIAAYLAIGQPLLQAVSNGQQYLYDAILHGIDVKTGKGNGPVNHFFDPQKQIKKST